jgi:hypothetical protein
MFRAAKAAVRTVFSVIALEIVAIVFSFLSWV